MTGGDSGWVLLRDEPGVEFLIGLVGQFWHRDYGIVRVPRSGFADFDEPGYAETLAGLSLRPYGSHRTLLTYESRTITTDPVAHRRFAGYWRVLRPFVALLTRSALITIAREAEAPGTHHSRTTFPSPLTP